MDVEKLFVLDYAPFPVITHNQDEKFMDSMNVAHYIKRFVGIYKTNSKVATLATLLL